MRYIQTITARLITDLTEVGVTLPAEVVDAVKAAEKHETRKPTPVGRVDIIDAYLDGKTDKQIGTLATEAAAYDHLTHAWTAARDKHAGRVESAILGNSAAILPQLADLAAPLIADLKRLAALPTTDTAALIRAGATADAEVAARAEITAGELAALYGLRGRVAKHADYGAASVGIDCSVWREPGNVREQNGTLDTFLDGIRREGGLWFPMPEEARRRAAELRDARRAASTADQVAQAQAGRTFF